MGETALYDLLSAFALMLVVEGLAVALLSRRLPDLLARMQELGTDQIRWVGLGMAILGTAAYLVVRS